MLIFCPLITLKMEEVAQEDRNEPVTSPSSCSGNGYDTEILCRAADELEAEHALQNKNTKKRLIIEEDDGDTSSIDDDECDSLMHNSVSCSISNSVNEDVIDGVVIMSRAVPSDKREDNQATVIPRKKTTGDNKAKPGQSSNTKCVSRVSDVIFCSTSIARSETLSSLSSNIGPPKKKAKCAAGLGKKKCNTITDNTMNPYTGKLRCRLDPGLCHLPEQAKSEHVQCAMHQWLDRVKKRSQIMYCRVCDIHLCLDCYKPFHQVPNIK